MHQGHAFSSFCLALTAAVIVASAAAPAAAVPAFREQFRAKYIKPDSNNPQDIALRDAFDGAGCNLCHVGEDRTNRNAYGRALATLVSRKTDTRNKEKIQAALDKVAAMKSRPEDPRSPSFGEIIASGKLPTDEVTVRTESSRPASSLAFNRDIRPILVETCFRCHGPDSAARKAGLRLDQREAAMKAGVLAPGKPEESELVRRVFSTDSSEVMPPPAAHKILTAAQKERLRQWIAAGAEYQPLWSFIAARAAAAAGSQKPGLGPQSDRPLHPGRARTARSATGAGGRPADARSAAEPRSDRAAALAGRGRGVRGRSGARRLREARASTSSNPRTGASTGHVTGSMRPATPIRTAFISTTTARCGPTATGSSTPSIAICPSIGSRSSSWPAICCPTPRWSSKSPRALTAATSRPTRAAPSPRNIWCSIPAIAPKRRPGYGWG